MAFLSAAAGRKPVQFLPCAIRRMLFFSFAFSLCLFFASFASGDAAYTVTDLGAFRAVDLNNQGQALGHEYVAGDGWHVLFYNNGATTDLGCLTGAFSLASSLNGTGVIAGWGDTLGVNREIAFTYQNGVVTPIDVPGAVYSYANDINDGGQVVGRADISGSPPMAFRYERKDGTVTPLGSLGTQGSTASAINNKGQIVGYSPDASGNQHVFLWENNAMTDLGGMGGADCQQCAISDSGLIVGCAYPSDYASRNGFLYDHGNLTRLGTLSAGDKFSSANSINIHGQVVGDSSAYLTSPGRAFLFESGSMTDLNELIAPDSGWILETARSINDRGQIVGNGNLNGVARAYLLTPTPEPDSLTLLAVAALVSFAYGARRKHMAGRLN
jgi:probable HAF family extracellular repeat protein